MHDGGERMQPTQPKSKMERVYNFGAGPAMLPTEVLSQIAADIPIWRQGCSVMELSHRLQDVMAMAHETEMLLRSLLEISDDYAVLFMHGGARTQFAGVPLNLLGTQKKAHYVISGYWSNQAYQEAKKYCDPIVVADSHHQSLEAVFNFSNWQEREDAAYLHFTDNETIDGVEFLDYPKSFGAPLVSDITSSVLTKSLNINSFGLLYASAQKNLGIAGLTIVIVRRDLLDLAHAYTPHTLHYKTGDATQSMFNTPPVFCWYVCGLILKWVKKQGGVPMMSKNAMARAQRLYHIIDSSDFYENKVPQAFRSRINVPFLLKNPELEKEFIHQAAQRVLLFLEGHRVVGGLRASLYNAMPLEGVDALVSFMKDFEKHNG